MKLSVALWTYVSLIEKGMSVPDILRHMHKNGVQYVELLDIFLKTDEEKKKAKEVIDELGMKVASYSITNNFVCDGETRLQQVEMVKNACQTAHYYNTDTIRVFCGDLKEGYDFDKAFDLIVKSFKECVKVAEKENIYFCLENHGKLAGKSKQIEAVIRAVNSKHLKITADTGNFLLVGENPLEAIQYLKNDIGLVHFKDFLLVDKEHVQYYGLDGIYTRGVVLTKGDVPLKEIIAFLKQENYQGFISIEYEGKATLETVEECIANTMALMK